MKRLALILALVFVVAVALPAMAKKGIPDKGYHWQMNIIGVQNPKSADMDNFDRRTIFVPLDKEGGQGPCKINYTTQCIDETLPTNTFGIIDGNATSTGGLEATIQVPCYPEQTTSYNVYGIALGKPAKYAVIDAHCGYSKPAFNPDNPSESLTCEETLLMDTVTVGRVKGKGTNNKVVDITDIFRATGCLDTNDSGYCDSGDMVFRNVWIFNVPFLEYYYWDYDANGLKLMQVRFYETTSGSFGTMP